MSDLPTSARAVVIGAGIVGNSISYHLSELGWRDLVLLDKGPFPNPGGSTGHASNFIFPVDHSKEMTALTLDSMRQYQDLDVFTESGGIEVARTEERMQELHRRMSSAHAWGIDRVSMVTPAEIKEMVPFIDETILLGGFSSPGVGVVDSLRAGTIMRERAIAAGALTISASISPRLVCTRVTRPPSTSMSSTSVFASAVSAPAACARSRMSVPARSESTTPTPSV